MKSKYINFVLITASVALVGCFENTICGVRESEWWRLSANEQAKIRENYEDCQTKIDAYGKDHAGWLSLSPSQRRLKMECSQQGYRPAWTLDFSKDESYTIVTGENDPRYMR